MDRYQSLLSECETLARAGQTSLIAKRMQDLDTAKVPRALRLPLAHLCRRAGLLSLGLRLLYPVIRGDKKDPSIGVATATEKVEYSALLIRAGVLEEALTILKTTDHESAPDAWLYQAMACFERCEPAAAIPFLEQFMNAPIAPYSRLIGRVNLVNSFCATGRWDDAMRITNENIETAKQNSYTRLLASSLDARIRIHIHHGHFASARADLERAARLPGDERASDRLFIRKWRAVLDAQDTGSAEPLRLFRAEAHLRQDAEGMREADLFALRAEFHQSDYEYLLFGTPFAHYRERIANELEPLHGPLPMPSEFQLGPSGAPCMDVLSGEISGSTLLNPGGQTHQVIEILLRDFYKPWRLGSLFMELFPGETFDIFSSPHRVHQCLLRTRTWLKESGLPAEIATEGGLYSLRITGSLAFRIPLERRSVERYSSQAEKLRARFQGAWGFSSREARELLGLSATAFKRFANWAIENGRLERHGASSATFYKIPLTFQRTTAA